MPSLTSWQQGLTEAEGMLRAGRWREGWTLYRKSAWGDIFEPLGKELPEWRGEEISGKHILVITLGGLGDNIMCFRWLGELKSLGARVSYLCPEPLACLFAFHEFVDELIPISEGEEYNINPSGYDCFSPIMALPERFRSTMDTVPWHGPYITAEPSVNGGVGLCTKANALMTKKRSMPASQRAALSTMPIDWVNLNYDENPYLVTWQDTAQVVAGLDAVVTVDTAVMHLSGAMGKPTFVVTGEWTDWKFGVEAKSCPFYPTVKVFKNSMKTLFEELKKLNSTAVTQLAAKEN